MHKSIVIYITLRYILNQIKIGFEGIVYYLSMLSIIFSIISLIIITSIINGFKNNFENNVLMCIPQILITNLEEKINSKYYSASLFSYLKGVKNISPIITNNLVLFSEKNIGIGVMLGIDPHYFEPLTKYLINCSIYQLIPGGYSVILSKALAIYLDAQIGDKIRLIIPNISCFTPFGSIVSQRLFTVIGMYDTYNTTNNYQLLINQEDAGKLMHYPDGYISGWRLWLDKPLKIDSFNKQYLPDGLKWKDYREYIGDILKAISLEENILLLLFSLILTLSLFNIISSIGVLVFSKQIDIAILKVQGLKSYQIMFIFILYGFSNSLFGSIIGSLLGLLLTGRLNIIMHYFNIFTEDMILPIIINPMQIIFIIFSTISVSIIISLYPSWKASRISPMEILKYVR